MARKEVVEVFDARIEAFQHLTVLVAVPEFGEEVGLHGDRRAVQDEGALFVLRWRHVSVEVLDGAQLV